MPTELPPTAAPSVRQQIASGFDGRGSADAHQSAYRPDIDGLRAIAVIAVIAFHLSDHWMTGGYLGVDIFFVISGYLITNVIWREAMAGNFSIARFYERRIRRIAPALSVVLLACAIVSLGLLLPFDLIGFAKSAFASLAFVANIYFWRDTDYFDRNAQVKPLLHLWSLGVEEQFYIFFPLLIVLCIRFRRSALLPIVAGLSVLSLLLNAVLIHIGGEAQAFYLLPSRVWELGAGALLVILPQSRIASALWRNLLSLFAATILLTGLFFPQFCTLRQHIPETLWAVVGAALLIHIGAGGGSWLTRLLSTPVLVWNGLISYSLYLWHWPILVFLRYYYVQEPPALLLAAGVVLMFVLATLSWRYVERPFRSRKMPVRRVLFAVGTGGLLAATAATIMVAAHGFPRRLSPQAARINEAIDTSYRCRFTELIPFGGSHGCVLHLPSHRPSDAEFVLYGNSHAQMYAPIVANVLRQYHLNGLLVPVNSCLPTPDFNESTRCMGIAQKNYDAILTLPRVHTIMLAMTWYPDVPMFTPAGPVPQSQQPTAFLQALDRLIARLREHGKQVIVVGPIAEPGWDLATGLGRSLAFHRPVTQPLFMMQSDFLAANNLYISHLSGRSDITFIRPDLPECEGGRCDYIHDGYSLFSDDNHLGSKTLSLFQPAFRTGMEQAIFARQQQPQREL